MYNILHSQNSNRSVSATILIWFKLILVRIKLILGMEFPSFENSGNSYEFLGLVITWEFLRHTSKCTHAPLSKIFTVPYGTVPYRT